MSLEEYLDRRIEKLVGIFTIAILFGKFVGDLAAYILTQQFGMYVGLTVGVLLSTILLIMWPKIDPDDPGVN